MLPRKKGSRRRPGVKIPRRGAGRCHRPGWVEVSQLCYELQRKQKKKKKKIGRVLRLSLFHLFTRKARGSFPGRDKQRWAGGHGLVFLVTQLRWLPRRETCSPASGTAATKHVLALVGGIEEGNVGFGSCWCFFLFEGGEIWKRHGIILSLAIFKPTDSYQIVTWCTLAGCQGLQSGHVDIHLFRGAGLCVIKNPHFA